jgi:hypothetical protein
LLKFDGRSERAKSSSAKLLSAVTAIVPRRRVKDFNKALNLERVKLSQIPDDLSAVRGAL